jgi:APA family basic amino acid/polyamine antiporter
LNDRLEHSKPGTEGRDSLRRMLGISFGVAVTVGGTIGVGILRTPGTVALQLGKPWLILSIWAIGGLYAFLGTDVVVELGAAIPRAGGWYVWSRRAFGPYLGFTVGWSDWLSQCATIAVLAIAAGEFSAALLPAAPGLERWIAVGTVMAFALLQWLGLHSSSRTQEITSALKALGLLAFVAACWFATTRRPPGMEAPAVLPARDGMLFPAIILALQSVIYTYDGWYCAAYFAEEDRDPGHNLPRSAFGGMLATLIIYLLVNIALMAALPLHRLASSPFPAAEVMRDLFGRWGEQIITALSALSLLSIINATLMMSTRILFAMGRDGLLYREACVVHGAGTPRVALLTSAVASILMILTGTFGFLIAVAAFFFIAVDASGFLALCALRKREPDLPRPYRCRGYPYTPVLLLIGCVAFLAGNIMSDMKSSLYALGLIMLSYPAYRIARRGTSHGLQPRKRE